MKKERRLSKIETLTLAKNYITALTDVIVMMRGGDEVAMGDNVNSLVDADSIQISDDFLVPVGGRGGDVSGGAGGTDDDSSSVIGEQQSARQEVVVEEEDEQPLLQLQQQQQSLFDGAHQHRHDNVGISSHHHHHHQQRSITSATVRHPSQDNRSSEHVALDEYDANQCGKKYIHIHQHHRQLPSNPTTISNMQTTNDKAIDISEHGDEGVEPACRLGPTYAAKLM